MKFFISTILIFLSLQSFADKNIICSSGECLPDFSPEVYMEPDKISYIHVGDKNLDNINVILPLNKTPRDLFLSVNNGNRLGKDLVMSLNSKKINENSGNIVLIGDIFNVLNLNLDGYSGKSSPSVSQICSTKFKTGIYGDDSKIFYENRRKNDATIPKDNCDEADVQYLQSMKFKCDSEGFIPKDFSVVEVERVKFKQKCLGISVRLKCVSRRVKITCEWKALPYGAAQAPAYPCLSSKWGTTTCAYNSNSCWTNNVDMQLQKGGGSSLPTNQSPPWVVTWYPDRCAYPGTINFSTEGMSGGAFAKNTSNFFQESEYKKRISSGQEKELCDTVPHPTGPAWTFNKLISAEYEEPGVDPDTLEPLPNSAWKIFTTDFFGKCDGDYVELRSIIQNWTAYGEIGNECRDVSIPEDIYKKIPWSKSDVVQDRSFGTEKIICSPNECKVKTVTKNLEKSFDSIELENGENGTMQGNGTLFIYDSRNLISSAKNGTAGNGGRNDLPIMSENKVCVKIDDVSTRGINSEFAINPVVEFNLYKWYGIKSSSGKPNGVNPPYSSNGIKTFKKIDSSSRYFLYKELFK